MAGGFCLWVENGAECGLAADAMLNQWLRDLLPAPRLRFAAHEALSPRTAGTFSAVGAGLRVAIVQGRQHVRRLVYSRNDCDVCHGAAAEADCMLQCIAYTFAAAACGGAVAG